MSENNIADSPSLAKSLGRAGVEALASPQTRAVLDSLGATNGVAGVLVEPALKASAAYVASKNASSVAELQQEYKGAAERSARKRGGSEYGALSFIGGEELDMTVIRDYESSLNSMAKQSLVSDLLAAMSDLGLKVSGDTYEEKIKNLLSKIPNSKVDGPKFRQSAESHSNVCRKLANVINKHMNKKVVDESAAPAVICQAVSELVGSLSSGMHVEFLVVHDNAKTILTNLEFLREQFDAMFSRVENLAENSSKPGDRAKNVELMSLCKLVLAEIDRQLAMLENLIDVTISPAESKLSSLLQSDKKLPGAVELITANPGESEFGNVLSKLLNQVSVTAEYALVVDQALKKVGLSVDEYANSENLRVVANKVSNALMSSNFSDDELYNFLRSAELLYKNYYRAKDIQKALQSNSSKRSMEPAVEGGHDRLLDVYNSLGDAPRLGGIQSKEKYGEDRFSESNMDRRLQAKHEMRDIVFSTFSRAVDEHMSKLMMSLNVLVSKIGAGVQLSDELDGFRAALSKLRPLLVRKNSYLALIGYFSDALSKERRETFVAQLDLIVAYCTSLSQMVAYQSLAGSFNDIAAAIKGLKATIDTYSDKVAQRFGAAEDAVDGGDVEPAGPCDECEERANQCLNMSTVGGASPLSESIGKMYDPVWKHPADANMRRIPMELGEVIQKFDYFYRVSQIKNNLSKVGGELDHYAEDYESLRGEAIAKKINEVKAHANGLLKLLDVDNWDKNFPGKYKPKDTLANLQTAAANPDTLYPKGLGRIAAAVCTDAGAAGDDARRKARALQAKTAKAVEEHSRVHQNFWRTVEALDEYMRVFTKDLVNSKGKLQDIKAMLDETEVIYDWYTAKTGKLIHRLFDGHFASVQSPNVDARSVDANKPSAAVYLDDASDHYYAKLNTAAGAAAGSMLPGNPYIVIDADDIDYGFSGFKQMRNITENLTLLKNILSVFISVGSTLGGKNSSSKVFMPPRQIFKNLSEWLEVCSFGIGGTLSNEQSAGAGVAPAAVPAAAAVRVPAAAPARGPAAGPGIMGQLAAAAAAQARAMRVAQGLPAVAVGGAAAPAPGPDADMLEWRKQFGLYMRTHNNTSGLTAGLDGDMIEEDRAFATIIKAMCAKVLTVVGLYDVLERPDQVMTYSQVRYMIGGSETPSINSAATELYVRLPLLMEFHRELFDFHSLNANPAGSDFVPSNARPSRSEKIAMLPEMEGPFSGLIKLVFQKARGYKLSEYSDSELKELVAEVNLVQSRMSGSSVDDILRSYVNEVNMRYGIISQRERNMYEREFGHRLRYPDYNLGEERNINVPLLPGEEDLEYERDGVAPSKRFEDPSLDEESKKVSPSFITAEHQLLVNRLRCKLDSYFHQGKDLPSVDNWNDPGNDGYGVGKAITYDKNSLRPAIKAANMKLRNEQNVENRFKIVAGMIRGSTLLSRSDHLRYAMFHETVITGLNTLGAVYTLLNKYRGLVLATDLATMTKLRSGAAPVAINAANVIAELKRLYEVDAANQTNSWLSMVGGAVKGKYFNAAPAGTGVKAECNLHEIAFDLLEGIYGLGGDLQNLVSIRVDEERIAVNFSRLREVCMRLMSSVRYFVDALRPHLDEKVIDRYVAKQRVGSLYWLQEQLVDKLFEGRERYDAPQSNRLDGTNDASRVAYVNLDDLNRILNNTLLILRQNAAGNTDKSGNAASRNLAWGQLLARICFYDNQVDDNSGLQGCASQANATKQTAHAAQLNGPISGDSPSLGVDYSMPMNKLLLLNQGAKQVVYPDYSNRYHQLYSWDEETWCNNSSLLFSFNQLVAKYLQLCFDTSAEKIYVNTINHLVNGSVNNSVMNLRNSYPDVVRLNGNRGTKIMMVSGSGGPVDQDALKVLVALQGLADSDGQMQIKVELVDALNALNPAFVNGIGANATLANAARGMQANLANSNAPVFVKTLIDQVVNNPNSMTTGSQAKLVSQKMYDQYYKNAGQYYVGNDNAVQGDVPVPAAASNPNSRNTNTPFGRRADPESANILHASLALMLKNILSSKNVSNQSYMYLVENLMEVSSFKKEALKAHLPAFRAMFNELQNKCEFMKKVMNMNGVTGHRVRYDGTAWVPAAVTKAQAEGLSSHGVNAVDSAVDAKAEIAHLQSICTSIAHACGTVLTCIDNVLRELADAPRYLELHADSAQEYRSANGQDPFTPLSTSLRILANDDSPRQYVDGMPLSPVGSTSFKLAYGARGLLNGYTSKASAVNAPGWSQFVESYNLVAQERDHLDAKQSSEHLSSVVEILRYLNNVRNMKGRMSPLVSNGAYSAAAGASVDDAAASQAYTSCHDGSIARSAFVQQRAVGDAQYVGNRTEFAIVADVNAPRADRNNNIPVLALSPGASDEALLDLTVNADRDAKLEELAKHVNGSAAQKLNLTVANILDLNIMPLNVHALMRDIPLANLYNYSYTFDRLLVELYYGIDDDMANILIEKLCQNNSSVSDLPQNIGKMEEDAVSAAMGAINRARVAAAQPGLTPAQLRDIVDKVSAWSSIPGGATAEETAAYNAYHQVLGPLPRNISRTPASLIKSPKEMFIALMLDPYRNVGFIERHWIEAICRGDAGLPQLSRPKFLGDQLLNKALFGELYPSSAFNPRGPRNGPHNNELSYQKELKGRENAPEALGRDASLSVVQVNATTIDNLRAAGEQRLDTVFVRNLIFMVNAYRSLRLRLRKDLEHNDSVKLTSLAVVRDDNTEFQNDQRLRESRSRSRQSYPANDYAINL